MRLQDLVARVEGAVIRGDGQCPVGGITVDSRSVKPGDLFVCIRGIHVDRHQYADQAVKAGAAALLVERWLPLDVPQVLVPECRAAWACAAAAFYEYPADTLQIVGVTGTNGKTTTTWMIRQILAEAGYKVGLLGTIANYAGDEEIPQHFTTPDPMELQGLLRHMADLGCTMAVMEVSAHALELHKLRGMAFRVGVFTNLTQDHLDDFKTMEKYAQAKRSFFTDYEMAHAVVNADDPASASMVDSFRGTVVSYGVKAPAAVAARQVSVTVQGADYILAVGGQQMPIHLPIPGHYNVSNSLAAAGACLQMGISMKTIAQGLTKLRNVPGRFEAVPTGKEFSVVVDYAHSPDGLENILRAVRELTQGRLLVVFGCGGDRDRLKRPIMGHIAGELADYAILTSDNPRTEQPDDIIDMIEPGLRETGKAYERVADRREAIGRALQLARSGDIVVIAGKGHEDYQEIMGQRHHFDDREVVREYLGQIR